jgi:enamine deaminase RidA (YjgF/YER057c/UK114 family)
VSGASQRLEELGLTLPAVPTPAAAYQPWSRVGGLVFTSGQLPTEDGVLPRTGRLGAELGTAEGAELARIAALNVLAAATAAAGDLEAVRVVKVVVFVACTDDFTEQHLVANGASTLIGEVLGEAGIHARAAVGVAALPLGSPVEVEAIVEVVDGTAGTAG